MKKKKKKKKDMCDLTPLVYDCETANKMKIPQLHIQLNKLWLSDTHIQSFISSQNTTPPRNISNFMASKNCKNLK